MNPLLSIISRGALICLCATALSECSIGATPTPLPAFSLNGKQTLPQATEPAASATDVGDNAPASSNVERAHQQLGSEAYHFSLIVVSSDSTGVEKTLYDDMIKRNIRATTGADEGIDARSVACYPNCVFVPIEAVNAIGVETWQAVLRHEYRHIIQVQHNPNLAADFRDSNGVFTTYAAFMEGCADYGLNVGVELYHAQERIDRLKSSVGSGQDNLLDQACNGVKGAYTQLVNLYNNKVGNLDAFASLFPPYR